MKPKHEPVAQPECDHDWRDRFGNDDPYALATCCKCGAVRGEDEPVAQATKDDALRGSEITGRFANARTVQ